MRRLLLDISVAALLFIVAGVALVMASYEDGYDWAVVAHGDAPWWTWKNYAEVKAWYCEPLLYYLEYHRAYCYATWGKAVIEVEMSFSAKNLNTIVYNYTNHSYDQMDWSENYNELATAVATKIFTRFYNALNGDRWQDRAAVTVIAGAEPE